VGSMRRETSIEPSAVTGKVELLQASDNPPLEELPHGGTITVEKRWAGAA
jgi:hypothetical protein